MAYELNVGDVLSLFKEQLASMSLTVSSNTHHMRNMTRMVLVCTLISFWELGHLVRQYVSPHYMFIDLTDD